MDKPLFQVVPFGKLGIGENNGTALTMMSVETADRYCDKPLGLKKIHDCKMGFGLKTEARRCAI